MKNKMMMSALALTAVALATGCTKDGKFNPSEKISRVYESATYSYNGTTETEAKHLTQAWTWDGKKLSSITNYDVDGSSSTVHFEYDGSQLTKAYSDAQNYAEFAYDGRKVKTAKIYTDGQLATSIAFTHDGNKITKMEYTANLPISSNSLKKGCAASFSQIENALWTVAMPCDARQGIMKAKRAAAKSGSKSTLTLVATLTWDGKNVSKAEVSGSGMSEKDEYTYDDMKNPYHNFLLWATEAPETALSKNNVTSQKSTVTDIDGSTYSFSTNYTYDYDDKWPEERIMTLNEGSYTTTYITYFEYVD